MEDDEANDSAKHNSTTISSSSHVDVEISPNNNKSNTTWSSRSESDEAIRYRCKSAPIAGRHQSRSRFNKSKTQRRALSESFQNTVDQSASHRQVCDLFNTDTITVDQSEADTTTADESHVQASDSYSSNEIWLGLEQINNPEGSFKLPESEPMATSSLESLSTDSIDTYVKAALRDLTYTLSTSDDEGEWDELVFDNNTDGADKWIDVENESRRTASIALHYIRRTQSEPLQVPTRTPARSRSVKAKKERLSLPDLRKYATPNLSAMEFAHLISLDEGDVGSDLFSILSTDGDDGEMTDDEEEDISGTETTASSMSTDTDSLGNLLEDSSVASSWSDLSLIIEGITVRRSYPAVRPYLITQLSAIPKTKSTTEYKAPKLRSKRDKKTLSESVLPNQRSQKYYDDCIDDNPIGGQHTTTPVSPEKQTNVPSHENKDGAIQTRTFMTETEMPEKRMAVAGAGGGYDPNNSSSENLSSRGYGTNRKQFGDKPIASKRKIHKRRREILEKVKKSPNTDWLGRLLYSTRIEPKTHSYWRKTLDGQQEMRYLEIKGSPRYYREPSYSDKTVALPLLPAIQSNRPLPQTAEVENDASIQTLSTLGDCFHLQRNSILHRYLRILDPPSERKTHNNVKTGDVLEVQKLLPCKHCAQSQKMLRPLLTVKTTSSSKSEYTETVRSVEDRRLRLKRSHKLEAMFRSQKKIMRYQAMNSSNAGKATIKQSESPDANSKPVFTSPNVKKSMRAKCQSGRTSLVKDIPFNLSLPPISRKIERLQNMYSIKSTESDSWQIYRPTGYLRPMKPLAGINEISGYRQLFLKKTGS